MTPTDLAREQLRSVRLVSPQSPLLKHMGSLETLLQYEPARQDTYNKISGYFLADLALTKQGMRHTPMLLGIKARASSNCEAALDYAQAFLLEGGIVPSPRLYVDSEYIEVRVDVCRNCRHRRDDHPLDKCLFSATQFISIYAETIQGTVVTGA